MKKHGRISWVSLAVLVVHIAVFSYVPLAPNNTRTTAAPTVQSLDVEILARLAPAPMPQPNKKPLPVPPADDGLLKPRPDRLPHNLIEQSLQNLNDVEKKQSIGPKVEQSAPAGPVAAIPPINTDRALILDRLKLGFEFETGANSNRIGDLQTDNLIRQFHPILNRALEEIGAQQLRRTLHHELSVAANGLDAAEYNQIEGGLSGHLKTDKGCFSKRSNVVGDRFSPGQRWWRTECKETRASLFDRALGSDRIEYDSFGRMVGRVSE